MPVTISVCIVVYKGYTDASECVKSIEKYTNKDILKTIYIVDNSPSNSDGSEEFKKFLSKYSDVVYIGTGENLGFGAGHNKIISLINSQYHAIVNPDIVLQEDALSSIIQYMNGNKQVGMIIPQITDEQGNLQPVYRKELTIFDMFIRMFCKKMFKNRKESHTLQDRDYSRQFQVPFGQGSFLVIRSDLFKALRGFDEGYFMYLEDADLCRRVNLVSKLVFVPEAKVIHKWEQGSHKSWRLFKHHLASTKYYFSKWGYKWF